MTYKICNHCIMDTSDPEIQFDEKGVCNHCKSYFKKVENEKRVDEAGKREFDELVAKIKKSGKRKKYDCVIGVSGGVDSSYVALLAKDLGLRALLVHLDNGWNSEIAVKNVKNIAKNTEFDLFTHVIDWKEFRDIQLSLFKASVVDIELATDHAIKAILFRVAKKFSIKYMLNGGNVVTEAIMPQTWRHTKVDRANLVAIHRKFGRVKLKTFPLAGIIKQQYYKYVHGIKNIKILSYLNFNRDDVISRLESELGWQQYGSKHHESVFTRFYQGYILPKKFSIDKRRCHYSNLICAGQLSREEALAKMDEPVYDPQLLKNDKNFVLKKLQFSEQEFEDYISSPGVSHYSFRSDEKLIERLLAVRTLLRGH